MTSGRAAALTRWSFGQLATIAGAPPNYLRTLPGSLAAEALNYGLRHQSREHHQLLVDRDEPWTVHAINITAVRTRPPRRARQPGARPVKTIRVDRGSRVRAGEQVAALEAPELVAQKAEGQSKLQSAEAQLGAIRSKAEANASTYDKLKAASATAGVVAGNDVVLPKRRSRPTRARSPAQQNVEAARQGSSRSATWSPIFVSRRLLPAS
jgi:hypothetical protein